MHAAIKNEVGKTYYYWTVLGYGPTKNRVQHFICRCKCGTERIVPGSNLRNGKSKSCGCYRKERVTKYKNKNMGIYKLWLSMKGRCATNVKSISRNYKERGIIVCDEWKKFEMFQEWALGHGYRKDLEIDRINVNGNYDPENCRFITIKENANNKRTNRYVTINGETHTVTEWAERKGMKPNNVTARIGKGWSEEKAIMTPENKKGKYDRRTKNGNIIKETIGIKKTPSGKYLTRINYYKNDKRKTLYVGTYETIEEAIKEREKAIKDHS